MYVCADNWVENVEFKEQVASPITYKELPLDDTLLYKTRLVFETQVGETICLGLTDQRKTLKSDFRPRSRLAAYAVEASRGLVPINDLSLYKLQRCQPYQEFYGQY